MFVYLDESGNLTKGNGAFFIVATFTVGDPQRIVNAFRRWQRRKFPRKLRDQAEVKFNDAHITDELRKKTIAYLSKQDVRIFYTYFEINNIPEDYRKKGKISESGLLYAEIVRATLELYIPITHPSFFVIRDRRTLKGMSPTEFHEKLKVSLLPKLPPKTAFHAEAVDSTASPQVQVADWICGALARYYEKKPLGNTFYNILKSNIVGERELFTAYWEKRWEK
jgi:hypothetical protein